MTEHVDPTKLVGEIQTSFEALKNTVKEQEDGIKAKFDDYVTNDKLQKIETSLQEVMDHNDKLAAQMAAKEMGSTDDGLNDAERAYRSDFDHWFRTGEGEQTMKAAQRNLDIRAVSSVGSDPDGGYAAPVEWDRSITDQLQQVGQMRQYASVQTVTGQGFKRLYNLHGATTGWVGETAARPETSTPTLGEYSYAFGEIYANPKATQRVLEDPEISIEAWIASEVSQEFMIAEATAFLSGDGVNKPKGVLNYDAATEGGLPASEQHPLGPIQAVASSTSLALVADDFLDLIYDMEAERSMGAEFYMNRLTTSLVRKYKDLDGLYLWQPPVQAGQPATLFGVPINTLYGMDEPVAGAFSAGEVPVMYGNMAETYRIFDRIGVSVLRDPYTEKPYVLFYTRKRVGGGLWNPEYMRYLTITA